jgi:hypothetical protein
MSLTRNQIVLDRFQLTEQLSAPIDMERWSVVDTVDGKTAELWLPTKLVAMRANAAEAVQRAAKTDGRVEALLPVICRGKADGRSAVIRPVVGGLLNMPSLSPEQVPALAAWFVRGITESGFCGTLSPRDLVIDTTGKPLLAFQGVVQPQSLASVPHFMAPEVLKGQNPTTASTLYGLGVWLFYGLTGTFPIEARTRSELIAGQLQPRSVRAVKPATPEPVAQLIARLLDPMPQKRVVDAPHLGPPARFPIDTTGNVAATQPAKYRRFRSTDPPRTRISPAHRVRAVVDLHGLSSLQQARVSALTGIETEALSGLNERSVPVTIGGGQNEKSAMTIVAVAERLGLPVRTAHAPSATGPLFATGVGFLSIPFVIGGILVFGPQPILGTALVVAGSLAALIGAIGGLVGFARLRKRSHLRLSDKAKTETRPEIAKITDVHRLLLNADLATPIQNDLEQQLLAILRSARANPKGSDERSLAVDQIRNAVHAFTREIAPDVHEAAQKASESAQAARAAQRELNPR